MTTLTLDLFEFLRKHISDNAARDLTPVIEQMMEEKTTQHEQRIEKSIVHTIEKNIDATIERKIEKEHQHLATKGDVFAVKEDVLAVKEKIVAVEEKIVGVEEKMMGIKTELKGDIMQLREDLQKQHRTFIAIGIAIIGILIAMWVSK